MGGCGLITPGNGCGLVAPGCFWCIVAAAIHCWMILCTWSHLPKYYEILNFSTYCTSHLYAHNWNKWVLSVLGMWTWVCWVAMLIICWSPESIVCLVSGYNSVSRSTWSPLLSEFWSVSLYLCCSQWEHGRELVSHGSREETTCRGLDEGFCWKAREYFYLSFFLSFLPSPHTSFSLPSPSLSLAFICPFLPRRMTVIIHVGTESLRDTCDLVSPSLNYSLC